MDRPVGKHLILLDVSEVVVLTNKVVDVDLVILRRDALLVLYGVFVAAVQFSPIESVFKRFISSKV